MSHGDQPSDVPIPSLAKGDCLPLAMWTTPRSVSNLFLRVMYERGDHTIVHEPFEMAYYLGPERISERYATETHIHQPHETFDYALRKRVQRVADLESKPLYMKETPFQIGPLLTPAFVHSFSSTFLLRHPAYALPSLEKVWPDFSDVETGYPHLLTAFNMVRDRDDQALPPPVVIDSTDLLANPPAIIRTWCEAVHIEYIPDALHWENGDCDAWAYKTMWNDFRHTMSASKGVLTRQPAPFPQFDEHMAKRVDSMRRAYDEIVVNKLVAGTEQ